MADEWVLVDRSDWSADEVEYADLTISASDISDLRQIRPAPPEAVKNAFMAVLVALGYTDPTWADVTKFLHSSSAETLAARLRAFDPQTRMTPAITRALKPLAATLPRVAEASKAAVCIALWVSAVYAYGCKQEAKLSNFAVLSKRFDNMPYHLLGRYKPSTALRPASPITWPGGRPAHCAKSALHGLDPRPLGSSSALCLAAANPEDRRRCPQ